MNRGILMVIVVTVAIGIISLVKVGSVIEKELPVENKSIEKIKETEPMSTVIYKNPKTGIEIEYPKAWYGPEIYETEDGFRLEIGTDKVYPYGTGIEERTYSKENSYYLVVQYNKKPVTKGNNTNPNLEKYTKLSVLKAGETIQDIRSLTTKVRNIESTGIKGIEYITTLPETAQTERVYTREVILHNNKQDTILIRGFADNVQIADPNKWKDYYKKIDLENLTTFTKVVESIKF